MLLITLVTFVSLATFGRILQITPPKKLIADSKLVLVGKVQSIKRSGITTTLSYPTWEGVSFQWLKVEIEVLEPFKGVRKGDIVHTLMLSVDKGEEVNRMYSPPGMVKPDQGDVFFLCLAPTPLTNTFVALTAPCDENLSIISLHRSHQKSNGRDFHTRILSENEQFTLIFDLVNEAGKILPDGAARLRNVFASEIGTVPTNNVVYLEWQTYTNASGWRSDVPKGLILKTNTNRK